MVQSHQLAVLLAVSFLFFGCIAAEVPREPAALPPAANNTPALPPAAPPVNSTNQSAAQPNESANTTSPPVPLGNVTNLPTLAQELTGVPLGQSSGSLPSDIKVTCAIAVREGAYRVNDKVYVDINAYTGSANVNFTYKCGTRSGLISTGGLSGTTIFCQFGTAGNNSIQVLANGYVCAQKAITILPARGNCSIDNASITRDLQAYYYGMTVYFSGFQPSDQLAWTCDYTTTTRTYGSEGAAGAQTGEKISCDFPEKPRKDYIEVYMGDVLCGRVSTR